MQAYKIGNHAFYVLEKLIVDYKQIFGRAQLATNISLMLYLCMKLPMTIFL